MAKKILQEFFFIRLLEIQEFHDNYYKQNYISQKRLTLPISITRSLAAYIWQVYSRIINAYVEKWSSRIRLFWCKWSDDWTGCCGIRFMAYLYTYWGPDIWTCTIRPNLSSPLINSVACRLSFHLPGGRRCELKSQIFKLDRNGLLLSISFYNLGI